MAATKWDLYVDSSRKHRIFIIDLPYFLSTVKKSWVLDVSITLWQGCSKRRKSYFMIFKMNGVILYEYMVGIVYSDEPATILKAQKDSFSALHITNEEGIKYTLTSDASGLVTARLGSEGIELPVDNSDETFGRIAREEASAP